MSRIFVALSTLPLVLLAATMFYGWQMGDYNGPCQELRQMELELANARSGVAATGAGAARQSARAVELEARITQALAGLEPVRKRARVHFLLGLATALTTVLVNSISVTYLIGTCRWCKEVVDAYGLSDHLVQQSLQLKRHTFPWSLAGMLAILCIVTLGAAADPATLRADTATWVVPHATAAVIGAGLIAWAFFVQALNLRRYAEIIDTVLREVREVRRQRGLEVEDEPAVVV